MSLIERDMLVNDLLDRLEALEGEVRELGEYAIVAPAAGTAPEQFDWSVISGWVITGAVLRDVDGLIVLDASVPSITIAAGGYIQSSDFVAGTSGFQINGGTAEFNDVVVRGTIYADVGEIGGWTISATALTGGNATLHSSGYLLLGTGNDVVRADAQDATWRLWVGHATGASAPFRVNTAGEVWALNAHIQGALHATVFVKDLVEARAGSLVVVKSAGVLSTDMAVPGSGTWSTTIDDPPGGGFLFANGDICRCKSEYSGGGIGDIWFTVSARVDNGDGTQSYTCTYQNGTRSITYPAGAPALDYGVSGDGGVLLTADLSGAPYLSIFTHAGSPWTTTTTRVRLGNLNGAYGISSDYYGIGVGDYSGGNYMRYEASGGFTIVSGNGGVTIDASGVAADVDTTYSNTIAYKFVDGASVLSGTWAYRGLSYNALKMEVKPYANHHGDLNLICEGNGSGYFARIRIDAQRTGVGGASRLEIGKDAVNTEYGTYQGDMFTFNDGASDQALIYPATGDIRTAGGIFVGGVATDPAAGEIWIPDAAGTTHVLEPDTDGSTPGLVVRCLASPAAGKPIFAVQSSGGTDRLIVTHGSHVYVGDDLRVVQGLYVGQDADPDPDDIHFDGNLKSVKSATTYDVYAFCPLTTPVTVWSSSAISTVGTSTQIDMSAVSGLSFAPDVKAWLLEVEVYDSDTWGAGAYWFRCGPTSSYWYAHGAYCYGGSLAAKQIGACPCDGNGDIWYRATASGSSTLTVTIRVWGYWI